MRPVAERIDILQASEEVGLLDDERGDVLSIVTLERAREDAAVLRAVRQLLDHEPLIAGNGPGRLTVVRMDGGRHENALRVRFAVGAHCHEAGLRHSARAVVEGRVRDVQTRQARHHGLEFIKELQRALARLGLIRRVGAVQLAASGDGPHGRGDVVLVRAGPDEAERPAVEPRPLGHEPADLHLAQTLGYARERAQPQVGRDLIEELLDAADTDGGQHRRDILTGVGDEGHQPPSSATSFWYSAAVRSAGAAPAAAGRSRMSQPLPYASELIASGSAASAGLPSVTSPAIGE